MPVKDRLFDKAWKMKLWLLLCSAGIYTIFLHPVLFNLNSLLSSVTLDSIKNYYTFVYHVKNDAGFLNFGGMNYPFGEHVIYTDCQPIVTLVLRCLPLDYNYLIGIMHFLLFFSFMLTPLILFDILRRCAVQQWPAFFFALAIALLSPQFLKINAGHHALAYGFVYPLSILLCLKAGQEKRQKDVWTIFIYNFLLFFLHPYFGFSSCLFCFIALCLMQWRTAFLRGGSWAWISVVAFSLLPLVLFRLFMALTDHHSNRTIEPYGNEVMVENLHGLVSPVFGPFKGLMEIFFNKRPQHFEGYSYLGFFTVLLALAAFVLLLAKWKSRPKSGIAGLLLFASLFVLFIAFGYHHKLLNLFGIKITAISQFRAVCRFAWLFYFMFPLFLVIYLNQLVKLKWHNRSANIMLLLAGTYLLFNMAEAGSMFGYNADAFWKFRNFFNQELLTAKEKTLLNRMDTSKVQALLPLPLFHGGSEMYDRNGSSNSMAPSMMFSYHSGLPILSVMMSRTSITETEKLIELFNFYKSQRPIVEALNKKSILVIKTRDALLPDEKRFDKKLEYFSLSDSLSFAIADKSLFRKKEELKNSMNLSDTSITGNFVFINPNRAPFTPSNMMDEHKILVLDSNKLPEGEYVLSFRYFYKERIFQNLALDLIITEASNGHYEWVDIIPIRKLSGFYTDFAVFEQYVKLKTNTRYEFILKGRENRTYHIANFMLRPDTLDLYEIRNNKDTTWNNFPSH